MFDEKYFIPNLYFVILSNINSQTGSICHFIEVNVLQYKNFIASQQKKKKWPNASKNTCPISDYLYVLNKILLTKLCFIRM